jgi:hypothetical protein
VKILLVERGFTKVEIGKKLFFIGVYDGSIFYGCKIEVSMQLKDKLTPYLVVVCYCAHHINLVIQTLSSLSIVM